MIESITNLNLEDKSQDAVTVFLKWRSKFYEAREPNNLKRRDGREMTSLKPPIRALMIPLFV